MGGGDWCFLLLGAACAVGAVHVVAMSSDRLGIRGVSGADVDWADGTVWSIGGPDVNQMGWYRLSARVTRVIPSVC